MLVFQGVTQSKALSTLCEGTCALTSSGGEARVGLYLTSHNDYGYGCLFSIFHVPCAAGYFCTGGAPSQICPAGSYCLASASSPSPCPAGTFGNATGLSSAACSGPCSCCGLGATTDVCTTSASPHQAATSTSTQSRAPSKTVAVTVSPSCTLPPTLSNSSYTGAVPVDWMFEGLESPGPLTSFVLVCLTYVIGVVALIVLRFWASADKEGLSSVAGAITKFAFLFSYGFEFIQVSF